MLCIILKLYYKIFEKSSQTSWYLKNSMLTLQMEKSINKILQDPNFAKKLNVGLTQYHGESSYVSKRGKNEK